MKKIKLTQNKYTLVDDKDFAWLNQYNWYFHSCGYAYRQIMIKGKRTSIFMHREIAKKYKIIKGKLYIDHKNGNGLDNQQLNLRSATNSQNQMNRKSLCKGINLYRNKKWRATIKFNQKQIHLGYFLTKIEAIIAYNKAAIIYFGNFARINQKGGYQIG